MGKERLDILLGVINGRINEVKDAIRNGADVNTQDDFGRTALYVAVEGSYTDIIKILIENGADVNFKDNNGWTALFIAASKGHIDIVKLLINNGANIDVKVFRVSTGSVRKYIESVIEKKKKAEKEVLRKKVEEETEKKTKQAAKRKEQEEKERHKKDYQDSISKCFNLIDERKLSEALKLIRDMRAPKGDSEKIDLLKLQSKIYNNQGLKDKEKQILESLIVLIELNDDSAEYYYSLGILYEESGQIDKAIDIYNQFVDLFMLDYKDINTKYKSLKLKLSSPEIKAKLASPPKPITVIMDALSEKQESLKERIDRQNSHYNESIFIYKEDSVKIDSSHKVTLKELHDNLRDTITAKGQDKAISIDIIEIDTKYGSVSNKRRWIVIKPLSNKDISTLRIGVELLEAPNIITLDINIFIEPSDIKDVKPEKYNNSYYSQILMVQEKETRYKVFIDSIKGMLSLSFKSVVEGKGEVRF